MTENQALEIMTPVSADWGRLTYGGTGAGALIFQISATQQIRVELEPETREMKKAIGVESQIDVGPRFVVRSIGLPERKGKWMLDANHNFTN